MDANKLAKLPAWARNHIAQVERARDTAQSLLTAVSAPHGATTIAWSTSINPGHALPSGATIRFLLGDAHRWVDCRIKSDGRLGVNGAGQLIVRPCASNDITVDIERY